MHPNPNGEYPQYPQPEFTPQAGTPQNVPNQLPPTQLAPPVPGIEIKPPKVNTSSFIPDAKTREILDRTYSEMQNSFINVAIKRFAEDLEHAKYFIKEEFLEQLQRESLSKPEINGVEKKTSPQADFSTW